MALFSLFTSKKVANSDVNPVEINDEQEVNNENETSVDEPQDEENKKKLITITWGTGMPIDVIFHYIHKNFEEEGFQDALVNSDITYRDTKEKIIRTDLEMLFKRIALRYRVISGKWYSRLTMLAWHMLWQQRPSLIPSKKLTKSIW